MDGDNSQIRGPDVLANADAYMTWERDKAVKLYTESFGPASEPPISVMTALQKTVDKSPDHPALGIWLPDVRQEVSLQSYRVSGAWATYTYKQYQELIKQAARSFIKLGLEKYHGVGIIGFNSPEWFISDLAAIFAGGFAVGIYTTNSPDACQYVAHNAECNIIVVENDRQLQKIIEVRKRLPHLRAIIQYVGVPKQQYPNVYTWAEMMALGTGDDVLEKELKFRIEAQAPNQCCTVIYTSGTTGDPKGVMMSHDNVVWTANSVVALTQLRFNQERLVTYLPLSHVAGQLVDIYGPMVSGATVYFAQPDALKGTLVDTLKTVRPTVFLGVPRVWEKMQEAMTLAGQAHDCLKQAVAAWAKEVGYRSNIAKLNRKSPPVCFCLANLLVFKKVRKILGLDRCRICISGAAPLMKETSNYFLSLNIRLHETYGMSECSGPQTFSIGENFRLGSVGREFPGASTKFDNIDEDGNGEIYMHGRHVFMGYLNMPKETCEALDDKGWLHSGDVGRKDAQGFLFITGRIKELIVTAGGENVPPVPIENMVKECLPCISNCILIGDKRKFLSMLLTIKTEVDFESMEPQDNLSGLSLAWCDEIGSKSKTVSQILQGPDMIFYGAIQQGITKVNQKAMSRAQFIQKWAILPKDFSIPGGEIGPTLKLKRPIVIKKYSSTIEAFYREEPIV